MAQNKPASRKKILFLITKATWGGAQRYVYDLATHLSSETYESVVTFGEPGKLAKMLSEAGIKTHGLSSLRRDVAFISDISSFFQILKYIQLERPSVLHVNSSKAAALGALGARIAGVKRIVFTVHGWPFNEKRNEFARVMMYIVSWFTAFLSHAVIVVSKSDETQGKKMRWVGNKIHYIPVGIEPAAYLQRDEASAAFSMYGFTKPIYSMVTIAELTKNKGICYAIEAIGVLKRRGVEMSYYIIGDGELRAELEDLVREEDVADRVRFLGFIEEAARYLRAFDIFLLPSIKEGMPYVLLEAAVAGLPVITTDVVNPDVIRRLQNIHAVPPADPEAIAEALAKILREKSGAELLPAQNLFPLSDMIEETRNLYLLDS